MPILRRYFYNSTPLSNKGFTLVEIVVGLTIIGFIIIVILNLPVSIRVVGESNNKAVAKDIASKIIEDLRSRTYENLANTDPATPPAYPDSRLSELPEGSANYIIDDCPSLICTSNPKESTKRITAQVKWKIGGKDYSVELVTLISQGGLQ